jgi:rhodanese-related sulfurtransferase
MEQEKPHRISVSIQIWILLLVFALLACILPNRQHSSSEFSPSEMIELLKSTDQYLTCDQVARSIVRKDGSILLVDIREPEEYLDMSIPGAINIPFADILNPNWSGYFDDPTTTTVLYANGTIIASEAWMLCTQTGYRNIKVMQGGLNKWFDLVMESEFYGKRITAAENALFEVRYRARDFFTTMNSLPDSIKTAFLEVKMKKEAELVGGCE